MKSKRLLQDLFNSSAVRFPNSIAIQTASQSFSYQELSLLSNQLAYNLINLQAKPNQLIAIVMEKGWEQVVAVLGILKSGAAYLPIDPNESKERLHYLLSTAEVNIVLTQSQYVGVLDWPDNIIIIEVDRITIKEESVIEIQARQTETDLAYVIFTSGSTGTPKGVMITHQSALNTILDINQRFCVNEKDKVLAISDLTFDLSVYDLFGPLTVGGTIVFMDSSENKDPTRWDSLIFKDKISIWNSVPILMEMFIEHLSRLPKIPDHALRLVLLSGDWIPINLPDKIRKVLGDIKIISLGGATEASIWSILYPIHKIEPHWKSIPYGKAMENQSFYILDQDLKPVTGDEKGELFIGGQGVAQGYWKDKERSDAQFIHHNLYGRLYKTGDLGRYFPDGNIEFLGRLDLQVKISGYRVEISAIEKYLLDFPRIRQAVVQPIKEGQYQKLMAYITLQQTSTDENNILLQNEQVGSWQKIYDELYQENTSSRSSDSTLNTAGWISSYLNEPVPALQMREWVNDTVRRIMALKPNKVLEIGCGTGLLLFRLTNKVTQYDATDFSLNTLRTLDKQLTKMGTQNVKLLNLEAIDTKQISGSYDTIILNSVAQYFPSIQYLLDVLLQCIDKITTKGTLFLGDIRSLSHLNVFHTSVLFNAQLKEIDFENWKALINKAIEEEDELVIEHSFFYNLKQLQPRITHVEILLKEGKYHNEMNDYRYDVILYIDHTIETPEKELKWCDWQDQHINLEKLHYDLIGRQTEILGFKNIPNKRTIGFSGFASHLLSNSENWFSLAEKFLLERKNKAIDPAVIYEIGNNHHYHVSMSWSDQNPAECFDVIFRKKSTLQDTDKDYLYYLQRNNQSPLPSWSDYGNTPLLPRIHRNIICQIKVFLSSQLPQYMIPSHFFILKTLPISINGKIDRKALPTMLYTLNKEYYMAPITPYQKTLAAIWKKILGVNRVGIHHSFYDLGGTSILVVQMLSEIYNTFGIKISFLHILNAPTIEKLGKLISKEKIQHSLKNATLPSH